ncbi:MAG: tetratricopeptide repeat protein [Candidatus Aminicenantes bacterium]|nr:tetratricopeptide repeat protein [Candidatus Aminicenantes bacterium]
MNNKNVHATRAALAGILTCIVMAVSFVALSAQENLGRGRIGGQVTDEAGTPLEGVRIVASSSQGSAKLEAVTDKKGRFSIIGLGTGVWRISAHKEGYDDLINDIEVFQLKTNPPLSLVMKKTLMSIDAEIGLPLIDQGNAAMEQGKFDEALVLYREFQAKSPDVYGIRVNIAAAILKKGDPDCAEAEYKGVLEDVLRVHGEYAKDKIVSVRALSGLGELAFRRGDLEAGRKYFTEALAVSPEDSTAAYNVGEIMFSNQNIDEAIRFFEMAVSIKKDWPKPYLKLGYVYLNKGEYDKSIENFEKFIALDPDNPEVPKVKGMIDAIEKMKK